MRARPALAALGTAVALLAAAPPAAAAPPERVDIDDEFADEFLSTECGVDVTTRLKGFLLVREFDRETGVVQLLTINLGITSTADGNVVRFRDVGVDQLRVTPDGELILSVVGQVPFGFKGVFRINLDTGEVLREPKEVGAQMLEKVCGALTR